MDDGLDDSLRIRFVGDSVAAKACAVAGAMAVPANSSRERLDSLVTHLGGSSSSNQRNELLVSGRILETSLEQHIAIWGLSREEVVEIEIVEARPSPKLLETWPADDWISCACVIDTGCAIGVYDGSVRCGSVCFPAVHDGAVKAVAGRGDLVVSGGHDCRIVPRMREKELGVGTGHAHSIDSIAIAADARTVATGDFGGMLFLWQLNESLHSDPALTTRAHSQCVSGLVWENEVGLRSASWDGTIKSWDVERLDQISTSPALGTALTCLCRAPSQPRAQLAGGHDALIRLTDDRCKPVHPVFKAHAQCVSAIDADPQEASYLFASAAQDGSAFVWDLRATKPLNTLKPYTNGHPGDRLLALAWAPGHIYVGGASAKLHDFTLFS